MINGRAHGLCATEQGIDRIPANATSPTVPVEYRPIRIGLSELGPAPVHPLASVQPCTASGGAEPGVMPGRNVTTPALFTRPKFGLELRTARVARQIASLAAIPVTALPRDKPKPTVDTTTRLKGQRGDAPTRPATVSATPANLSAINSWASSHLPIKRRTAFRTRRSGGGRSQLAHLLPSSSRIPRIPAKIATEYPFALGQQPRTLAARPLDQCAHTRQCSRKLAISQVWWCPAGEISGGACT